MMLELDANEVGLLEHALWVYSNQPLTDAVNSDNAETIRLKVLALTTSEEKEYSNG